MTAIAILVTACSGSPAQRDTPIAEPPRDWVAEIRAEAAKMTSHIEVLPLQDTAVEDLRRKAFAAEAAKQFEQAEAALDAALAITPNDPSLWQWRAEIALAMRRFDDAIAAAETSAALGPKLGDLCVRNWLTIAAARQETKDAIGAAEARAKAQACPVPAPIRM